MSRGDVGALVQLVAAGSLSQHSDRELLERFVGQADQAAFTALVHRHGPLVLGVCRRVLHNGSDAEDAFQATFLILAKKAGRVRWQESVRSWLYQVAFRVAREARTRRLNRQRHEQAAALMPRPDEQPEVTWQELSGILDEELSRLPEKYRSVLVLCYLEGKTRDEAAEALGWSVNSVKKRLESARELLRGNLARRGLPLSAALLAALLTQHSATAAVPSLLLVAAVRVALEAPGSAGSVPVAVITLAEGVLKAMTASKLKMASVVLLLVALLGIGSVVLHRSLADDPGKPGAKGAEPGATRPLAEPGKIARSKPDKLGLVTVLRPLVTQLAPGDPVRIALHWETEKGPLRNDHPVADEARKTPVRWHDSLNAMTFTLTAPDGQRRELRPKLEGKNQPAGNALYYGPTLLVTLAAQSVAVPNGNGPWADGQKAVLDAPGLYTIQISGSLVRTKAEPIPFQVGPITIERTAGGIKTLAQIEAAAKAAMQGKEPGIKRIEEDAIVEDEAGNRLVRFRASSGPWNYTVHTMVVKADGTPGVISERPVSNCIAQGTLLDGETGPLPVDSVRPGERLWGFDPIRQERVLTTVRGVRQGMANETLVFGDTLRVTAAHPLYVNGGWQEAGEVGERDELLTADLRRVPAGVPQRVRGPVAVYDLTVDGPHNFFADGFLVHNKDRLYSPQLDDPYYQLWPMPQPKK